MRALGRAAFERASFGVEAASHRPRRRWEAVSFRVGGRIAGAAGKFWRRRKWLGEGGSGGKGRNDDSTSSVSRKNPMGPESTFYPLFKLAYGMIRVKSRST